MTVQDPRCTRSGPFGRPAPARPLSRLPHATTRTDTRIGRWVLAAAPCVAFLCVAAVPAAATVVLPAEFSEMVSGSQVIVHGRVSDVQSQMLRDQRSIETVVTLVVTQSLKGEPGPVVVFRVPNGQVGRYRRVIIGAPEFRVGDEVVLFLRGRAPGVPMPYGLNQGVYRVQRTGGGQTLVSPLVVVQGPGAERIVRGDPARRPVSIDAFAQQVREIASRLVSGVENGQ